MQQQLIDTPRGPIEFVVVGTGPPVLCFHGTPCGNELALRWEGSLKDDGFRLVIPNRPGFYRTPLADRTTTADCAEVGAAVLDHLGIECAAVIGTSAGGPPALAFAARFPARTAALVLECAQTHAWDDPRWAPLHHPSLFRLFKHTWSRWLYCQVFPILFRLRFPTARHYLHDLTGDRFSELKDNTDVLRLARDAHRTVKRFGVHRRGYYNDLSTWYRENVLSTVAVTCPTLLLYDPQDPCCPFCHAEYAASAIPGAELVSLHAGGHMIGCGRDGMRMRQHRAKFLRENHRANCA